MRKATIRYAGLCQFKQHQMVALTEVFQFRFAKPSQFSFHPSLRTIDLRFQEAAQQCYEKVIS